MTVGAGGLSAVQQRDVETGLKKGKISAGCATAGHVVFSHLKSCKDVWGKGSVQMSARTPSYNKPDLYFCEAIHLLSL